MLSTGPFKPRPFRGSVETQSSWTCLKLELNSYLFSRLNSSLLYNCKCELKKVYLLRGRE